MGELIYDGGWVIPVIVILAMWIVLIVAFGGIVIKHFAKSINTYWRSREQGSVQHQDSGADHQAR